MVHGSLVLSLCEKTGSIHIALVGFTGKEGEEGGRRTTIGFQKFISMTAIKMVIDVNFAY